MQIWDLPSVTADGRRNPQVLLSTPECRAVLIDLREGEGLGEHSVRERATITVVSGSVTVAGRSCGAGTFAMFEPHERHDVRAQSPSRVLLVLAPWPGDGHYADGESADPQRMPANATAAPHDS